MPFDFQKLKQFRDTLGQGTNKVRQFIDSRDLMNRTQPFLDVLGKIKERIGEIPEKILEADKFTTTLLGPAGLPNLIKKIGLPTSWVENLAEEVKMNFPFTKEGLKELENVTIKQVDYSKRIDFSKEKIIQKLKGRKPQGELKGQYFLPGQEIFNLLRFLKVPAGLAEKVANLEVSQRFDKPTVKIEKDLRIPLQKVMAHELLHHFGLTRDQREKGKFLEDFYNSWNMLVQKDPEKYSQLLDIDENMTESGYDMRNPFTVSSERFSFLGEKALDKGAGVIPEELREFYEKVIQMPQQDL